MPPQSFGFCGGFFQSAIVNADAQTSVNWFPEALDSGEGKNVLWQRVRPGMEQYCSLTGESKILGIHAFNGKGYAAGKHLWDVTNSAAPVDLGLLNIAPSQPITFADNHANQLLVCAEGNLFVYDRNSATLTAVSTAALGGAISQIGFVDGYFTALLKDSNKWYISDLEDGTSWDAADVFEPENFAENIVALPIVFGQVWAQGRVKSIGYVDTGDLDNPFQPGSGAIMEQGNAAPHGGAQLDNSYFWIGLSTSGQGMAWRANGYTPQRVSNHAIESEWAGYSTISDAIGWAEQLDGHCFWVIYFPTANKTWVYDAATKMWHERRFRDSVTGQDMAFRARCHMLLNGQHIVGDWKTGTLYKYSGTSDFGNPIIPIRRAAYIKAGTWASVSELHVIMATGDSTPIIGGDGFPREQQVFLRWSDDGGHTWSNERTIDAGLPGTHGKRVISRRLGRFWGPHGRIFEVSASDPIAGIVDVLVA